MSKKIVYLYGNCHVKVIAQMLCANAKFNEKYRLIGFKGKVPAWYAPRMQIKRDLHRMINTLNTYQWNVQRQTNGNE